MNLSEMNSLTYENVFGYFLFAEYKVRNVKHFMSNITYLLEQPCNTKCIM